MKYVIVSPRQVSGGSIALHALCKYLSDLGYDSRIFYYEQFLIDHSNPFVFWPKWSIQILKNVVKTILAKSDVFAKRFPGFGYVPVRGHKCRYFPWVDDDTIVVYPESIHGNILQAKNVVRWLLYFHNYGNQAGAYDKNDLFFCYREVFNDDALNPDKLTVCTPYFDLDTYKQYNFGERHGTCYIVRKGKNRSDLPKEFDGIILDDLSEKEIAKVFNSCEYCVSYDTQTAYSALAALCGCTSIVIPEPGKERKDYISPSEEYFGIAYDFSEEELQYARQTHHKLKGLFEGDNQKSKESAQQFAQTCEAYFKDKK